MKSFLTKSISPDHFWEFAYLGFAAYLLFHPALSFPQSRAVALGGGLVLLLFRTIQKDRFEKLGIFWHLFLLYALVSSLWSVAPGLTLQSSSFLFLGTLLIGMAGQGTLSSQNRIESAILILALLASALAIEQWLFGFSQLAQSASQFSGEEADIVAAAVHNRRAFGPLVTPGALAAFLIFVLPQVVVRFRVSSGFKKIVLGFLMVVFLSALAATGGVGAWICLAIIMGWFFYKQEATPRSFLITGLLLIMALSLIWRRGFHSWTLASFSMRIDLWHCAWQLFLRHPFLGWGWGTFAVAYQTAGFPLGTGALFAHNLLFQLLVETGGLGTLLFVGALGSLWIRLQWPSRWEGWGVLGGLMAVFLFSFMDLPFQMVELLWIFAGAAGRLEWRSEVSWKWPEISPRWVSLVLLIVLAITGFWPPYRPWNFCLLAITLWTLFALFERQIKKIEMGVGMGAIYLALRAFNSSSASGATWFLELTGLLIVFYALAPRLPYFQKFKIVFASLGLLWAVKLAWYGWQWAPANWRDWISFQSMDVPDWIFYPNPKYLAIFLIPFMLFLIRRPFTLNGKKGIGFLLAVLIVLRLKALSALVGVSAGWLWSERKNWKKYVPVILILVFLLAGLREFNHSSTKWGRWSIWESALQVWSQNPLWGVGPGVFAGAFHQIQAPRLDGVSRYLMDAVYAHNEFLDLLAAFGLVGFFFVLILGYRFFQSIRDENKSGWVGLGVASFFNFCLHAPLIALLGVCWGVKEEKPVAHLSLWSGFLTLGLVLGLFGAPIFSLNLIQKANAYTSRGLYPEAFQCWYQAVYLNAWNGLMSAGESKFYENLYMLTKDETWKNKSDDAFKRAMDLEKANGNLVFEDAQRWTDRYERNPLDSNRVAASQCWAKAETALPLNAFVTFEEGLFWTKAAQEDKSWGLKAEDHQKALVCYTRSTQLEPNFAAAWVNQGLSLPSSEAKNSFQKALMIYDQWKDAPNLSPTEKQLVNLPPEVIWRLRKGMTP